MLSLIILFFIGKYFYELAQDYHKHRWLFLVIGIATYYIGGILGTLIVLLINYLELTTFNWNDNFNVIILSLLSGGISTISLYLTLDFIWNKKEKIKKDEIQNIGKKIE